MHGRVSLLLALLAAATFPSAASGGPPYGPTTIHRDGDTVVVDSEGYRDDELEVQGWKGAAGFAAVIDRGASMLQAVPPCTVTDYDYASCGGGGIERIVVLAGDGDDDIAATGDVPVEMLGEEGDDLLDGIGPADVLDGGPGSDVLIGHGGDALHGGEDDDYLDAATGHADAVLDCGSGDDDVDADNALDPAPVGCEVVAPEFTADPTIHGAFVTGGTLALAPLPLSGTLPATTSVRWDRCDEAGTCSGWSSGEGMTTFTVPFGTQGHRVRADVSVRNRAGSAEATTPRTPVIALAPGTPDWSTAGDGQPTPRPIPGRPRPLPAPEPREVLVARVVRQLTAALPAVTRALERRDPRKIGPKGLRLMLATPVSGTVGLRWTVPAAVARRHGVRPASDRPLVVARAHNPNVFPGRPRAYDMVPTALGRKLLARAPKLRMTLTVRLVPTAMKPPRSIDVRRPFTLRRR